MVTSEVNNNFDDMLPKCIADATKQCPFDTIPHSPRKSVVAASIG
jgi:ferredoxin